MSDRYKYAKNGIYKCENFAQQVWRNYNFDRIGLDTIGGIFIGWYLKCEIKRKNGRVFLSPVLSCEVLPKVRLRTFLNVLKKDGSSGSLRRENNWTWYLEGYKSLGKPFDVSELLNPENEYLDDDGALSIEYGIQFDVRWDECWMFNFHDTVFNYTGEENQMVRCTHTINRDRPSTFYCSAEILNFHCPQFVVQAEKIDTKYYTFRDFFRCLQILHGVRIQLDCHNYLHFLETAQTFNLSNVIHYCDRPYIKGKDGFSGTKTPSFETVVNFGLRHILAAKLRTLEWRAVVKRAKKLDFKEATGEVMKTFVAKILYN